MRTTMKFVAWVLCIGGSLCLAPPQINLSGGPVFGTALPASGGVPVDQYLGIPFGAPTRRWEAPEDFRGSLGPAPFNATMWGSACLQVLTQNATYGSEDCLKINVWAPAADPKTALRPVMVFVYGKSAVGFCALGVVGPFHPPPGRFTSLT